MKKLAYLIVALFPVLALADVCMEFKTSKAPAEGYTNCFLKNKVNGGAAPYEVVCGKLVGFVEGSALMADAQGGYPKTMNCASKGPLKISSVTPLYIDPAKTQKIARADGKDSIMPAKPCPGVIEHALELEEQNMHVVTAAWFQYLHRLNSKPPASIDQMQEGQEIYCATQLAIMNRPDVRGKGDFIVEDDSDDVLAIPSWLNSMKGFFRNCPNRLD